MVIDIHTHCFPDALAQRALASLTAAGGVPPRTDGTVKGLKKSMAAGGVDCSVIQHIATRPAQTPGINRWAAEINGGSVFCFGTIHPDYQGFKEEIRFLKEAGVPGIKFHPDYQDFFVAEKRMYPIYEAIAEAGLTVLFHAGLDIGIPAPYKCMPDKLRQVLDDFPGLTVVAAHMGGYDYWNDVEEYLLGEKLYLDTSYCLTGMDAGRMRGLIRGHGADKILFGSDSPWKDQGRKRKN